MTFKRTFAKRAMVAWLVYAFAFGPLSAPMAYAASGDFSDVPLPSKKRPNPNLVFVVDDSGSMDAEISIDGNDGAAWYYTSGLTRGSTAGGLPGLTTVDPNFFGVNDQNAAQAGVVNFNFNGDANGDWKKYIYLFPNGVCGANCSTRGYGDADNDHFAVSPAQQFGPMRSPDWNRQYYNPTITYLPWKAYNDRNNNGSGACPSGTASGSGSTWLCTPGNADPRNARSHPIYGTEAYDLTATWGANTNSGRYFRLYDGFRIPNGARFRRCTNSGDNSGCEAWQNANALLCVGDSTKALTTCNLGSLGIPNTTVTPTGNNWNSSGKINMSAHDHIEMAMDFVPARYFLKTTSTLPNLNISAYSGFPTAASTGPLGESMYRIDITSSTTSYPKAVTRTDCAGSTCTYAEEMQNFANWFQYYRKRHMSLNAALGNAMEGVRGLRGGYFQFNNRFDVTMRDYDSTDTQVNGRRILGDLYRIKDTGGTPTRDALEYAGRQYTRNDANAPIQRYCQFNAAFVITDGFATDGGPGGYGDYDSQTPAGTKYPTKADPTQDNYVYNQQYVTTGTPSVNPYRDGFSDTMADVAMYYYTTNLRPELTKGGVPVDLADVAPEADRNVNLHMNLYGLILGLRGNIFGNLSTSALVAQNQNPYANPPDWGTTNPRTLRRNRTAIDELWHATINARGAMLKADSPEETRNAVLDVVNAVVAKGGAAAAVSVSSANPVPGDNFVYVSSFNSGAWAGDLAAFPINLTTGLLDTASPQWVPSAQLQLADRSWTTRRIATYNPGTATVGSARGIPFVVGATAADKGVNGLTASQETALTGLSVGGVAVPFADVVNWLRGDRSKETTTLRSRGPRKPATGGWPNGVIPTNISVLGDIVNAEPVIVNPPQANFGDQGYAAYKSSKSARTRVVYQGANDGMVHAFNATTGAELWAYIPSFGFLARQDGSPGLRNLADKEFFVHKFFVDATPVAGDVDFGNVSTAGTGQPTSYTSDWRTILVGGLAKGGRGWYALDVTDPAATTDGDVAGKVLWEFPNASTPASVRQLIGYSHGRPIIAKTRAYGWVVIVASGYENGAETGGDGAGYIFVLDPRDGRLLNVSGAPALPTLRTVDAQDGVANATARANKPLGLAQINGLVLNADVDRTVEALYGGDLYGNLWKFDISNVNATSWTVSKVATFKDASSRIQPITTKPALAIVRNKRVIYVGTGQYFGDKDIPDRPSAELPTPDDTNTSARNTQTFYAVKDDPSGTPAPPIDMRASGAAVQQTLTRSGTTGTLSSNTVDWNTKAGWYLDLGGASSSGFYGERIITDPSLAGATLAVTTNIPSGADPCLPGGASWFLTLDARTGSQVPGTTVSATYLGNQLASRVVVFRLPGSTGAGDFRGLIRGSSGTTFEQQLPSASGSLVGKRKAWRELIAR